MVGVDRLIIMHKFKNGTTIEVLMVWNSENPDKKYIGKLPGSGTSTYQIRTYNKDSYEELQILKKWFFKGGGDLKNEMPEEVLYEYAKTLKRLNNKIEKHNAGSRI